MGFRISISFAGIFLLASFTSLVILADEPLVLQTSPEGIQKAEIIAASYSYTPDHLIVKRNVPVELTIHSKAWIVPHTFILKDTDAGVEIKEDIPAGQSVVVKFTPARPGLYKFYCDKRLLFFKSHQDRGMRGTLEVKE